MDRNAQWRLLMDRRLSRVCEAPSGEGKCGNLKHEGDPYCIHCWKLIPRPLRPLLNEQRGYEETIRKADEAIAEQVRGLRSGQEREGSIALDIA